MKTIKMAIIGLIAVTWSLALISSVGGESPKMQVLNDPLENEPVGLQSSGAGDCTNHCDDLACFASSFGGTVTGSPCDSEPDDDVDGIDLTVMAGLMKNTFEFEGGKIQLPNDGNRLLVVTMEEEYLGSVTYQGYLNAQEEPVVTGFTIDIGEGLCTGSVDDQTRPLELTLPNGAVVTFTYNGDGTFNYIFVNGDTTYSGENLLPLDPDSMSAAGSATIGETASAYGISESVEDLSGPITRREAEIQGKQLLNIITNEICRIELDDFRWCFASSLLTELVEDIDDLSFLSFFIYINGKQVEFARVRIDEIGHCGDSGHEDYNEYLCKINDILKQGWEDYFHRHVRVVYAIILSLSRGMVTHPTNPTTYTELCACQPVAYTGLGEYSHTIIAKFGNMGRATCRSDAVWSLVLNPDNTSVQGAYIVLKKAHQTTGGDVYCIDLDPPQLADLAGQYSKNPKTFWVQGGDFYGDNRFEGSYDLMQMTGSGSYERIDEFWETYAYHTNVVLYRAECDQNSDCNDLKWCNGFEECYLGTCLEGNPPCEPGEICNENTYKCESPPPGAN